MEPHQRPSYRLASFARSGFAATSAMASSPASSSVATVLSEGALARGLLRLSTIPQPDATNYSPARHQSTGDIISDPRATSSVSAPVVFFAAPSLLHYWGA